MNAQVKTNTGNMAGWALPKAVPNIDDDDLMKRWQSATNLVSHHAALNGWTKSEVSRRADIAIGTFSGWYDGTYNGRYDTTTLRVENFLTSFLEASEAASALPSDPGLIKTRAVRELFEAFTYAQALPTIAVVTMVSGLGKTTAAEAYKATRPHVFHVTFNPSMQTPHAIKLAIGHQLGIDTRNSSTLQNAIVHALKRDGFSALLICDEIQGANEDCINELRYYRDMAKCGLVLLGNDELKTPYASRDAKHASPQVSGRVGHRMSIMKPYQEDIDVFLDAWQLTDPDVRAVASTIAKKPGAFHGLTETIKAGSMIARGMQRALIADDLRAAYQRRGAGAL